VNSELQGFYKKSLDERLDILKKETGLETEEIEQLKKYAALDFETADRMIENVVGAQQLPMGIASNFKINGKDYIVPMGIEEPSVVAAASNAAKIARAKGGFETSSDKPIMIGQIQIVKVKDMEKTRKEIDSKKDELIKLANECDPILVKFGGGARDLQVREITENMLCVHLLVDVKDAMGANAVNTMVEAVGNEIEKITGEKTRLKIISNLAVHRKARAKAVWDKKELEESFKGKDIGMNADEIVEAILEVYELAANDQFRASTHNKGIMNGIDAVAVACGQDWRAIEAGAHAYAAFKEEGKYLPLTKYYKDSEGNLVGEIEMPLAVGLVGGAVKTSPIAGICVKILGVKTAQELAEVIVAVGLAQNFAAIRAIATRGIQAGHMQLHAKNIAVAAGAKGAEIEEVAKKMAEEKQIRADRAKEILDGMRK